MKNKIIPIFSLLIIALCFLGCEDSAKQQPKKASPNLSAAEKRSSKILGQWAHSMPHAVPAKWGTPNHRKYERSGYISEKPQHEAFVLRVPIGFRSCEVFLLPCETKDDALKLFKELEAITTGNNEVAPESASGVVGSFGRVYFMRWANRIVGIKGFAPSQKEIIIEYVRAIVPAGDDSPSIPLPALVVDGIEARGRACLVFATFHNDKASERLTASRVWLGNRQGMQITSTQRVFLRKGFRLNAEEPLHSEGIQVDTRHRSILLGKGETIELIAVADLETPEDVAVAKWFAYTPKKTYEAVGSKISR